MAYTAAGAAEALDNFTDQTLIMALSTTDPASSVTEPVGNGYARQTLLAAAWAAATAASPATITTTAPVDFGDPSGTWGDITHWALYDATGTTLYRYGTITGGPISPTASTTSVTVTPTLQQAL